MSSISLKADLPYEAWVHRAREQEPAKLEQRTSTRGSRNAALKQLLIPYKTRVSEAVAAFQLQLERVDNGLTAFLQAEQMALELSMRHSALFRDFQIPVQLTSPNARTLLREYVDLARSSTSVNPTAEEIVSAVGILRSDTEPRFQAEKMSRLLAAHKAKEELLEVLADRTPLESLLSLLDVNSALARRIFAGLGINFRQLAGLLTSSPIGETSHADVLKCVRELEQSFHALRAATDAYRFQDLPMSSDQLSLAELPKLARSLSLPPPPEPFDALHSDLHALTRDEKQAYLVVTRHLDVLSSDEEKNAGFIEVAIQERDQLLDDLIRRLEISGAGSVIATQARRFTDQRPGLSNSLNSLIVEANDRLEEELVRIQCEAQVNDEIARYLARQRFASHDLRDILEILASNPDLQQCFATILRDYNSMPSGVVDELRVYLKELDDTLSLARNISPILFDSALNSPGQQLASPDEIRNYREELEVLGSNPEKLRAQELSSVIAMTAALLERHFPCAHDVSAQYLIAAQIVVLGFAPQMTKGQVDRPIRDCRSVVSLVARVISTPPSTQRIHETIHSHLIPHLLVCKNHSQKNQARKLYQLQRNPPQELRPVIEHLEYIANHPLVGKKKGAANQSSPTARQHATRRVPEIQGKARYVDPAEQLRVQQQARERAVVGLRSFLAECQKELSASIVLASGHTDVAQQLQGLLDKLSPLSARLSSSLRNGLGFQEQTNYKSDFEKSCFSKLRQRVGFNPLGLNTKSQKVRAKRMNLHDVTEHVVDCILQTAPGALGVLEVGKRAFGTLREVEAQLSAPTVSFLHESFATIRTRIATCLAAISRSESERATALASCIGMVSTPEPFVAVQRALQELGDELQKKTIEAVGSDAILRASTESAHHQSQHQGVAHGNE